MQVQLDDGSVVNILAEGGVNAYLRGTSNVNQFSKTVEQIKKIQKKNKKRLNAYDKQQIITLHTFFENVSSSADFDLFREKVPESEIQCWLEFTIGEIKRFTAMPKWIKTGNLENHETHVLSTCMPMFNHAFPVVLAFESEFFEALGDLVKARRKGGNGAGRALPTDQISGFITNGVCNAYYSTLTKFDNNWPAERGFRKLDDSGVLEEFLRCATAPIASQGIQATQSAQLTTYVFNELQGCPAILKKRFKKSDTCGKVVKAILAGNEGSTTPRPDIRRRLQEIATFMDSMDRTGEQQQQVPKLVRMCRKCGKNDASDAFQESLMRCGRCQNAFYCSKACQRADWKDHKPKCTPATKSSQKQQDAIQEAVKKFIRDQYVDIMVKMVEEGKKTATTKKDMLVYLDFCVNKDGIVPAMQDPPMFDVVPTQRYLDRSFQSEEPDWVKTADDRKMHLGNIESRIRTIKDQYSRMTPMHSLFYVTFKGGHLAYKIDYGNMYSDEAFEAFRSAINDQDFEPMSRALDPMLAKFVCAQLATKHGILPGGFFPGMMGDLMGALDADG